MLVVNVSVTRIPGLLVITSTVILVSDSDGTHTIIYSLTALGASLNVGLHPPSKNTTRDEHGPVTA